MYRDKEAGKKSKRLKFKTSKHFTTKSRRHKEKLQITNYEMCQYKQSSDRKGADIFTTIS